MEPKCPNLKIIRGGDECGYICDLVDKWCLIEYGQECEIYNESLKEVRDE